MKFIDLHCDTLMLAFARKQPNIIELPSMLDVKRMKLGGALAQFFAMFMLPPGSEKHLGLTEPIPDDYYIDTCIDIFNTTMKESSDIRAAYNAADLLANEAAGKMSGFLTFEDGRAVDGSFEKLKAFYDRGIRLITLTWNFENCFGFPNSSDAEIMSKGLKPFGKEAIEYMNELGILIDVSHLSDGGFMDVAKISKKPFVASHSNLRSLSPDQRNLTDEMFRILAEKGGVSGINYGPEFLNSDLSVKDSTCELMSAHIRKMIDLAGTEGVALGSDLDGISGNMEMKDVSETQKLFDKLSLDGVKDDVIEKIAYKNALRVITESMK